ncbi:hypothetical protein [Bordetella petrii]|uniref:hypothetical protein n=1 Tax=Bordetella petrii TaxID=94624 RepID=UPI001A966EAF|nr:hypothetical protein [Bordetella petrii]MBO1110685.1 hypothetical protein [Bordetella petrii]
MPILKELGADGSITLTQIFCRPAVYLDHWALMQIADKSAFCDELVRQIKRLNGTLIVTQQTIFEFSRVGNQRHPLAVERLFGLLYPNLYFADLNQILGQFDRPPPQQQKNYPPSDTQLLRSIVLVCGPHPVDTLRFSGLLAGLSPLRHKFDQMCNSIAKALSSARVDQAQVALAHQSRPDPSNRVRTCIQQLLRTAYINHSSAFTGNDASDLCHAVAALCFSDYALLDAKWADLGRQLAERAKKENCVSYARTFSKIETFLAHLAMTSA